MLIVKTGEGEVKRSPRVNKFYICRIFVNLKILTLIPIFAYDPNISLRGTDL